MTTELRGVERFNAAFRAWARGRVREAVVKGQRFGGLELLRRVVLRTPVGNPALWARKTKDGRPIVSKGYVGGRLRGNWRIGIGQTPSVELEREDASGAATIAEGAATLAQLDPAAPFTFVSLANPARHAQAVENGHSGQAPAGMLSVSVNELGPIFGGGGA